MTTVERDFSLQSKGSSMSFLTLELTPLQRYSAFIILVVLGCSVALLWSTSEFTGRAVGAALALGALCLAVIVSLRKEESANRVRRYSLYVGLAVSLAAIAPTPIQLWLATASQSALERYGIQLPLESLSLSPSNAVLVFAWGVIAIVNLATIDWSAMGRHPRRKAALFKDRTLKERLRLLCQDLKVDLGEMDTKTDWRHTYYVPLDAEVDVLRGTRRLRRVQKLLTALRRHPNSRIFLVLGDPGAGKSVALRKLCRELLDEVEKTGRIPLYVNLREWRAPTPWTDDSPPAFDDLKSFCSWCAWGSLFDLPWFKQLRVGVAAQSNCFDCFGHSLDFDGRFICRSAMAESRSPAFRPSLYANYEEKV